MSTGCRLRSVSERTFCMSSEVDASWSAVCCDTVCCATLVCKTWAAGAGPAAGPSAPELASVRSLRLADCMFCWSAKD